MSTKQRNIALEDVEMEELSIRNGRRKQLIEGCLSDTERNRWEECLKQGTEKQQKAI